MRLINLSSSSSSSPLWALRHTGTGKRVEEEEKKSAACSSSIVASRRRRRRRAQERERNVNSVHPPQKPKFPPKKVHYKKNLNFDRSFSDRFWLIKILFPRPSSVATLFHAGLNPLPFLRATSHFSQVVESGLRRKGIYEGSLSNRPKCQSPPGGFYLEYTEEKAAAIHP